MRRTKKLNFNINKFLKFKDKINYLIIDDLPLDVKSFKKDGMRTMLEINFKETHLREDTKSFPIKILL